MVAFIALFIDTMIVFFAFIAGESEARPVMPHVPLAHWMRMAYLHRLDARHLDDARDDQCARFLRQDSYLRQVMLEDGQTHWCLTDAAYAALVELTMRVATGMLPVAEPGVATL